MTKPRRSTVDEWAKVDRLLADTADARAAVETERAELDRLSREVATREATQPDPPSTPEPPD